MKCPKCEGELRAFELMESVTLDLCSGCKGIWYDKGELGFQQELEKDLPDLKTARQSAQSTAHDCPRCGSGTKLEELKYHTEYALLIDRCPKCRGIFLDFGELAKVEKIVAQTSSFTARLGRAMKDIEDRGFQVTGQEIVRE